MRHERIRVYRNILPIDHYLLKKCHCFAQTRHCSNDAWGFKTGSEWASHVRLPAPEECRQAYLPNALILASTEYGGYRIVMPADAATVDRELTRHRFLRAASPITTPVEDWRYDLWAKKWLRDVHKLKSLTGREALQLFLEKVGTYTPEMLPYVLECGAQPNKDSILSSQTVFETLAEV